MILTLLGCVLTIIGLALFLVDFGERLTDGFGEESGTMPAKKIDGPVVIDTDGSVIVPDGIDVWPPERRAYEIYESLCNKQPIRSCADSYEWYLQDVVGTPITEEHFAYILGHYADPHPNYHEVTGEE